MRDLPLTLGWDIVGMEKMFERFMLLFNRVKTDVAQRMPIQNKTAPVKNETLNALTAGQNIDTPAEAYVPETKPETLLLPSMEPEPVIESKPAAERNLSMPLPSSISGEEVAMVQHAVKKTSTERFKYVEKPFQPMEKEEQKKPEDIIKYKIKPLNMQTPVEHKDTAHSDVIVYGGKTQN